MWQAGDYERLKTALTEALAAQIADGTVAIDETKRTRAIFCGVAGRWELTIREKRSGAVCALITPTRPPFTEDELAALRRVAREERLGAALRSSGGHWEKKLAERLTAGVLV